MKNSIFKIRLTSLTLLTCILFTGCSILRLDGLEKRHYRAGFYFDRNSSISKTVDISTHRELTSTNEVIGGSEIISMNDAISPVELPRTLNNEFKKNEIENKNSIAAHINTARLDSEQFYAKESSAPYSYIKIAPSDANKKPDDGKPKHTGLIVACTWGFILIGVGLIFRGVGNKQINDPTSSPEGVATGKKMVKNSIIPIIIGLTIVLIGIVGDSAHTNNVKKKEDAQKEQEQNAQYQNELAEAKYEREKRIKDSTAMAKFESQAKEYRALTVKPSLSEEGRKYIIQATALAKEKNYDDALQYYLKASSTDPTYPPIYHDVALLLATMERYSQAIYEMKKFLLLDPDGDKSREAQDKIYVWEVKVKK